MALIQPPEQLKLNGSSANAEWKSFKQAWNNYEIASGVHEKEDKVRVATFLHVAGPNALEKYNGFIFENNEDKLKMDVIIEKFDADCLSKTNVVAERLKFLKRRQQDNETCDQFVTQLRVLVSTCNYINPEEMLRDQFILQVRNNSLREKLLDYAQEHADNLTFQKAIGLAKNFELSIASRSEFNDENQVFKFNKSSKQKSSYVSSKKFVCKRCKQNHERMKCPAYGQKCRKCSKMNHFAICCNSNNFDRNVHLIEDNSHEQERNVSMSEEEEHLI